MIDNRDLRNAIICGDRLNIIEERAAIVLKICINFRKGVKEFEIANSAHPENIAWLKNCGIDYYNKHINLNSLFNHK